MYRPSSWAWPPKDGPNPPVRTRLRAVQAPSLRVPEPPGLRLRGSGPLILGSPPRCRGHWAGRSLGLPTSSPRKGTALCRTHSKSSSVVVCQGTALVSLLTARMARLESWPESSFRGRLGEARVADQCRNFRRSGVTQMASAERARLRGAAGCRPFFAGPERGSEEPRAPQRGGRRPALGRPCSVAKPRSNSWKPARKNMERQPQT